MGLARRRVAARLGLPGPFAAWEALARLPDGTHVRALPGQPVTPGALDALLVAASVATAPEPSLAGLFAWTPPGPAVRAVPVDDARHAWLRWECDADGDSRVDGCAHWDAADLGQDPTATFRCVHPLPGGGVALGSDHGLVLCRDGRFESFPWPAGARREARRVEALAVHDSVLHVATAQGRWTSDLRTGRVAGQRHPPDDEGGQDELCALLSVGGRLLEAWRTRLVGGRGPADTLAMAADPHGVVYAGTRQGALHVVDGDSARPVRTFGDSRPRPIRHLAWARGALWVAAAGALHRFDGCAWHAIPGEPTGLAVDRRGTLWALHEGGLAQVAGAPGAEVLVPVDLALERPWALAVSGDVLWIGGLARVWRVALAAR
ncbi:MAG: hypothetical protein RLZZ299_1719 [Pseudomonadota bacterium]|jgi:hypothetical protein